MNLARIPLIASISLALASLAGCGVSPEQAGYRKVSAAEAQQLMETEQDYVILDVRTRSEYDSGHIPGAVCLPNEDIGSDDPAALPDKDQLILVYCRSGNRSAQAVRKLAALGYTNVVDFGGINAWPGEIER
ncbi:rhodanese-like domain-containing protein [Collinsella tanakaei]|uniref:rhodanese-like domain-containing protein n=1 Tax=Collinsella tanakaei TaxID=626935 RepID=UPI0025A3B39A|nr:rhodanese-like domain-containing protein [Collinsella tanakaei]MDM8300738.1 rhodanese-like domain-containing protein [Collinsella tanakaei]